MKTYFLVSGSHTRKEDESGNPSPKGKFKRYDSRNGPVKIALSDEEALKLRGRIKSEHEYSETQPVSGGKFKLPENWQDGSAEDLKQLCKKIGRPVKNKAEAIAVLEEYEQE